MDDLQEGILLNVNLHRNDTFASNNENYSDLKITHTDIIIGRTRTYHSMNAIIYVKFMDQHLPRLWR